MQRASLTVVDDARGLLAGWPGCRPPPPGTRLDLHHNERNHVGRFGEVRVRLDRDARDAHGLHVALAGDGWIAGAFGVGVVVDGESLPSGGTRPLADGATLGWPALGVVFRFEHVDGSPLEHRLPLPALAAVLVDASVRKPDLDVVDGRWSALVRRAPGVFERALIVSLPGSAPALFAPVDGAPVRVLCARGGAFEPPVAVAVAAQAARLFAAGAVDGEVSADAFVVGWDGVVRALPGRGPRRSDGRGVIVELLARMLPDEDAVRADPRVHDVWGRVVAPYLGAMEGRDPRADDAFTTRAVADALADSAAQGRPVDATELAAIARGLCPASWAREQELREELALVDDDVFADWLAQR